MTSQTMTSQGVSGEMYPPLSAQRNASASHKEEQVAELSKKRQLAFDRAQRHSRAVFILRRLLPVLAVFCCFAYFVTGKFSLQFKDHKVSVEKIDVNKNELKMTNPRLEGHDKKAGSYLVTAATATQKANSPYVIRLDTIDGKLDHPKNGTVFLKAQTGVFDTKQEILQLSGDLEVKAPNGMIARLDTAKITFKQQKITSDKPVYVQMDSSTIRADKVHIDGLTKIITFQDRVKVRLIKTPKRLDN
ncbi:MAG: LPS export ABC transporter periplasmic protein LptC [Rhizobiales bacterium]|nr:LPS export ABC transporter periplasmic protein LptC [Hyphomicrobiales bacterium]